MKTIVPHLWYDKEAKEAATFYASIFPESRIDHVGLIRGTPSGDCETVEFTLGGHPFMAISAGPYFKFNPSISFIVNHDPARDPQAREHQDAAWAKLAEGGRVLMPLDQYPFSERYGWIQDRFGLSWQLILTRPEGEPRPFIIPSLMFTGAVAGKADEAIRYYVSAFAHSKRGQAQHYPPGMEPDPPTSLMFGDFNLNGGWFAAMDSARVHDWGFNEAVSLMLPCESQAEIDKYWKALSADPAGGQCGWTKDRYGVHWQVSAASMQRMLKEGSPAQLKRVTQSFLGMKKFDLAALERAYQGA
jgi:predicted 3-demethylubiquinone-9 3-methyltransferase (glyoxalase superfamily)